MIIINQSQCGFYFENGIFKKLLPAGKYGYMYKFENRKIEIREMIGVFNANVGVPISILLKNESFKNKVKQVKLKDNEIALHYVDGCFKNIELKGDTIYWDVFEKNTFEIINMDDEDSIKKIPQNILKVIPSSFLKRIEINEGEIGILYINNKYSKILESKIHYYWTYENEVICKKFTVEDMSENILNKSILTKNQIYILLENEDFKEKVNHIILSDNEIAIRYVNGYFKDIQIEKEAVYFNVFEKNTFKIIDMTDENSIDNIPKDILKSIPNNIIKNIEVNDGEVGLLYFDNKYVKKLESGVYWYWLYKRNIDCKKVNIKAISGDILGQEILTADKVSIRINISYVYRIIDPISVANQFKDFENQVYTYIQLEIRDYISNYKFDELMERKPEISKSILEKLKIREKEFYIEFLDAGLKDIILPGEIKDILNTVLIAQKKAQANVITRREEVASTRSLLNTAKLMEENKTLFKLKEMEYIEKICNQINSISISGGGNVLNELQKMLESKN